MRKLLSSLLVPLLVLVTAAQASAQQRQITGTVTGPDRQPIAAASVRIAGSQRGVNTDAQGRFVLPAPAGDASISVSRIGFTTRTVAVPAGQGEVAVQLQQDILNLEAVVVTGQATAVRRQNLANSVAVVSGDNLQGAPAQTVERALQGKVAGANIAANSGAPGGGLQISLRGISSIGGSADPLFVVDGVIVSNVSIPSGQNAVSQASRGVNSSTQDQLVNRIADINPNDIENIEILKGASASAIYGSKASNGVVIITTRRGRAGRPQLRLTQRFGMFEQNRTLGARRWTAEAAQDHYGLSNAEVAQYFNADGSQKQFYDNEEAVFGRRDLARETSLSVSGGTEQTRYFVSGLLQDNPGIAENTGYEKQALQLNLDQAFGSRATLAVGAGIIHSVAARGLTGNDNAGVSYYSALSYTPSFIDISGHNGVFANTSDYIASNPAQTAALSTNDEDVWRAIGSANLSVNLFSGGPHTLRLVGNGGVDYFQQRNDLYFPLELQFENDDELPGTAVLGQAANVNLNTGVNLVHVFAPESGFLTATTSTGMQYEDRDLSLSQIVGRNTTSRIPAFAAKKELDGSRSRNREFGVYLQEELLALDEHLSVTAGLRADRSSANADEEQYYLYPKAAASYRLDTPFNNLDELKFRIAYGSSGNLPFYGQRFTSALGGTNLEGVLGLRVNGAVGDPDLHPERTTELEGGIDAVLLGGNARLELTAYNKTVSDFIITPPLAPSTGFGVYAVNAGRYRVRGVEAMLEATPIHRNSATWLSRVTFAADRAKVLDLGGDKLSSLTQYNPGNHFGFDYGGYRIKEGESPTAMWGYDVDDEGNQIEVIYGDANPDFRVGFSNDISFGPVAFYALLDWAHGGLAANLTKSYYDDSQNGEDWTGCNTSDTCAGAERVARQGDGVTQYIEDAGYVKLREVSVSYALPSALLQRVGRSVSGARLTLSGRDLITWTDYTGLNPEVSNFGNRAVGRAIDVTPFPTSRSIWLGLDVTF
ncbi:SusC/RagA family TonB-linked outer membrane protein [Longimicrobium terrae]|uniref:TonB-linked SusC/RagA family outer membrane protein n=1 Tax=Longimicrobium terrae TaxID=1639882 RepID=A0A841H4Z9_9BACT|nr:SusC/RagA family TonB-linked outer membrane protein [Longimicrobium terrae]MBB4638809.1 TonB-linked SusC/RagA family outer membrane protein [Longimicrobium terrae]MBB6073048.1 TonB-linked SusC/RagA family outer membrane protein [Longimicrobium terrae]NNC33171.1 SusC/RagA family TonB-linked outer membrane protein [Longimicrobium terrae]